MKERKSRPRPDLPIARRSPPEPEAELCSAIIARGRTLTGPIPGEPPKQVGFDPTTARAITRAPTRRYLPGQCVSLPRSEFERLRALGFLLDPADVREPPAANTNDRPGKMPPPAV
jgi:hypothetical protein